MQPVCENPECMIEYSKRSRAKDWRVEKKERIEKLMTLSEWLQMLQTVFNTYIRVRDRYKPCVSCDVFIKEGNGHASHFYSVGSYPNLRFDERNVHKSCERCNLHLHGNLVEYALRLPNRIGQDQFDALTSERHGKDLKLTIPEAKELIASYKAKIKELNKQKTPDNEG